MLPPITQRPKEKK